MNDSDGYPLALEDWCRLMIGNCNLFVLRLQRDVLKDNELP